MLSIRRLIIANQRTTLARRPEVLSLALRVMRHHSARALQNHLRRAVVLLQSNRPASLKILFELENVFDVSAAPTINRLILVADNAHVATGPRQQLHQLVLWPVCILVFIDQDVFVTPIVSFSSLTGGLEESHCLEQE